MWILILTLVSTSGSTGQTAAAVPGFTSEASCIAAGTVWKNQVMATADFRQAIAVCAKA